MERVASAVRILVARAATSGSGDPLGTLRALVSLGGEARVELVHDAVSCVARCRSGEVDLVVAEREPGSPCDAILEELRDSGPPVVVVCVQHEQALEAFRRGAADCVSPAPDSPLPRVALEQLRRWRDFRERGASERRIRDLERYNENIIQNMNSALLVVDAEGRIALCNSAAERILGAPVEALRGRSAWEWFGEGSEPGLLAQTLHQGSRFKGAESLVRRADGEPVPVGVSCAPLFDAAGSKLGAVAIFQDLTEVKQLQRQVVQSEKMASIGQLAAGVAHEINNPMGFIHANLFQMAEYVADLRRVWVSVEALQKSLAGGEPEDVKRSSAELAATVVQVDVEFVLADLAKAVRESQEGSERIRHIVHDLREFSHHDAGERMLADVNQCLDSTAQIVWPMMKHLVSLEKQYAELPGVRCYPMQLKQVFMNLLVNAYQAIEERIGESGATGHIHVSTARREDGVVVAVRDDGVGICAENLDRVFDPFFTTKKVGAGTGLGLSTSFHIVQRHGGTLSLKSRPGEGTTFEVFLPLDGEEDGRDD